ncbi:response regulator [Flavisolibacter sp. BT320]|nr:response regulator [Flavisolibacter longurius]
MSKPEEIIIIEDDRDDQDMVRDVLQQLGVSHPLVFFDDCEAAYQHLQSRTEKPFLILCDINMPKLNGIEFKRKIEADEQLRSLCIPFVFLTTSDNPTTVKEAYGVANLQGYFHKKNTLEQITAQLKVILDYWHMSLHPACATK